MHLDFQGSTGYNSQDTESTKMSTDRKMKTAWYVYTSDYYSAIKENETKILAAAWMD